MQNPVSTLINAEDGKRLEVLAGAIKGVEMDVNGEAYAVIFHENNNDTHTDDSFSFKVSQSKPTLYITGLKGGLKFSVDTTTNNNNETVITITESQQGTARSNANGVMTCML